VSNIEPLARALAERVFVSTASLDCFASCTGPAEREAWVNAHWECVAADLEAGIIDDSGNRTEGADWRKGLAAYQERIGARPAR